MSYGFLIDIRRCTGCHGCTIKCNSENDVPDGLGRTWVESVEIGAGDDTLHRFQVVRCNHCAFPPCVPTCPIGAMFQRDDGIVDFNRELCIGCGACILACPYDAIYVDPREKTIGKCNLCAHRLDQNLQPACVSICPENAIVAGDLDDPLSPISKLIASETIVVREPEHGTAPRLFYIGGIDSHRHLRGFCLAATVRRSAVPSLFEDGLGYEHASQTDTDDYAFIDPLLLSTGCMTLAAEPEPLASPLEPLAAPPSQPPSHTLHWRQWFLAASVPAKGLAAGVTAIASLGFALDLVHLSPLTAVRAALCSVSIAGVALIFHLGRPERFLSIFLRPRWRSWLTRGALLLTGLALVLLLWLGLEEAGVNNLLTEQVVARGRRLFVLAALPLSLGTVLYTSRLFSQPWQRTCLGSLLPLRLLTQAGALGSGVLLISSLGQEPTAILEWARLFACCVSLNFLVVLFDGVPLYQTEGDSDAPRPLLLGYWIVTILGGHIVPLLLVWLGTAQRLVIAVLLSICASAFHDHLRLSVLLWRTSRCSHVA